MKPNLREGTNDSRIWKMVFEDNLYGLSAVRNATILDIGAHIGSFSLKAAELGARRVLAVEANPENFALLKLNVNSAPSVGTRFGALDYGTCTLVPVSGVDLENTGRIFSGCDAVSRARYFVPRVRLETLLDAFPEGRVDLLKLDCQGAEWQAFNEAASEIWERCGEIVGEIHADLQLPHLLTFLHQQIDDSDISLSATQVRPRDWAIQGLRNFGRQYGFETVFSLDEEDENSAEFHCFRSRQQARCGIVADA